MAGVDQEGGDLLSFSSEAVVPQLKLPEMQLRPEVLERTRLKALEALVDEWEELKQPFE